MKIERFKFGIDEKKWNSFLNDSKNSTFLFNRAFMDYHKKSFKDHSLLVHNDKGTLLACFPANEIDNNTISSHSGLTYGAFILKNDLKLPVIIEIYTLILEYYFQLGFAEILYKVFPRMYNKIPSDEIDYCLFLSNAELYRRDTALVINLKNSIGYSGNIKREAKKAESIGAYIVEENDFEQFWNDVLTPNLQMKFGIKPVHAYSEIKLLKNNFPDRIKLYVVKNKSNQTIAGTVIFETELVAHCQYISSTDEGRRTGGLNFLFTQLIDTVYRDKDMFDFGIANENNGKILNRGLLAWKERMGGRSISHDFYKIKTNNHFKLKSKLN